nr:GNAT family N-acetyltransferase [Kibdelosporangium sp. MJ126-NF4]CEL18017.1 Putative oxidoreductase [Kibdelosporangium sp. MJ126-NF4]CTQ90755.1 Putative oxidoreductase [Kibdelosporangium sp. MJ126-NF4]
MTPEVSVYASVGDIGKAEWDRLAGDAPVFHRFDFVSSIESDPLTRGTTAKYLVARDRDGSPRAAAVLYLQEARDPFAPPDDQRVRRMLVGHMWHCYDTWLLASGPVDTQLITAFWREIERLAEHHRTEIHGMVNVALGSDLAVALEEAGITGSETTPRYQLKVPSPGEDLFDQHLSTVGRASRRCLRQYWRRAQRAGVDITFREGKEALDDAVLELCLATADKHAPGYYPPEQLSALIRALGPNCRILRVELDGVLLATSICLLDETRAHFWAGGCLYPQQLNWSPQYVLFAAELRAGFESGRPVVEFGRRNDEFKRRYGLTPIRLGRFTVERTAR